MRFPHFTDRVALRSGVGGAPSVAMAGMRHELVGIARGYGIAHRDYRGWKQPPRSSTAP